ncbi:hypothetical protein E5288_WYG008464 [Bos mutus]|uniref:Integrator complex subunit 1 n=1 Tax=Bos mutus TaxID=72004 RepID=A0A6B0S1W4_9CETA|nr:hypothetical protein [Bos mutus]
MPPPRTRSHSSVTSQLRRTENHVRVTVGSSGPCPASFGSDAAFPTRSVGHPPPGDFIALGSKGQTTESKTASTLLKPAPSGLPSERKRDAAAALAGASALPGLTKRPKLSSTPPLSALGRLAEAAVAEKRAISPSIKEPSVVPIEVPPTVLLDEIEAAELEGNDDRLEGVLCGAVKQLKVTRAKPDSVLYLSLMYLAKMKPNIFATEGVIEALCSLLRRDASVSFKAKGNSLVSVLACNLLMAAYEEDENWPEIFVKVYIEDSLGERIWVDSPHCRTFVDNIQTAFNTKMPPKSVLLQGEAGRGGGDLSAGSSPHPSLTEEEDSQTELLIAEEKLSPEQEGQLMPRYEELAESVEEYVLDMLRDQLNRRQPIDSVSRNLLRLLTSACGYKEARLMAVQSNYSYPPCTLTDEESRTEMINRELQVSQREKQEILAFEGHLAAASTRQTITESSSLLLSQLTSLEPQGPPRRPPPHILDQVKGLNQSLRLGHLLCRSRNPDFLLNIIQRQASSQSMPWLADLVQSSEGSLDVLPVQCLCEFLLHDAADEPASGGEEEEGESKEQKARKRQDLLLGPKADEQTTCEVLDYFLRRLGSSQVAARVLAMKGLSLVLSEGSLRDGEEKEPPLEEDSGDADALQGYQWLLRDLPRLPLFESAIHMETDPQTISAYLVYLSQHTPVEEQGQHSDLALDVARLIVERSTIMSHLFSKRSCSAESDVVLAALLSIFSRYVQRMRKSKEGEEVYSWSESQDQVFLRWSSGETATMHILVVHAMVILLTLGPPRAGDSEFQALLDIWFPEKKPLPTAFLVDTSEEALLLPDWLKLRMIRSEVPRLVDAALQDLEPQQLLLFVQSFGIPVSSMSKLLQYLDQAVAHDPQTLEQNIMDKNSAEAPKPKSSPEQPPGQGGTRAVARVRALGPEDDLAGLLLQIFPLSPGPRWKSSHARPAALALQQALGRELARVRQGSPEVPGVAVRLLQALATLLSSPHGGALALAMHRSHVLACPLMRQLCQYQRCAPQDTGFSSLFLKVLVQALQWLDGPSVEAGPLQAQLRLFAAQCSARRRISNVRSGFLHLAEALTFRGDPEAVSSTVRAIVATLKSGEQCDVEPELISKVLRSLIEARSPHLEELLAALFSTASAVPPSGPVAVVSSLLLPEKEEPLAPGKQEADSCSQEAMLLGPCSGLLVDWLEMLDPEVVGSCPDLQQRLLFSRGKGKGHPGPQVPSFRPYLLALLTHQSSWSTLHQCIRILLGRGREQRAGTSAPHRQVWGVPCPEGGVARARPCRAGLTDRIRLQKRREELVLRVQPAELVGLVELILAEAEARSQDGDAGACGLLQARLPLLLSCCRGGDEGIKKVTAHLTSCVQQWGDSVLGKCSRDLLVQLYLQRPDLRVPLPDVLLHSQGATGSSVCKLDGLIHRFITLLADTSDSRASESRVADASMACRKLAVAHPLLLLRHLPMIAALLHGRTHLNFQEFRQQNHLTFFMHVLGVLELLQPQVFQSEHQGALWDCLLSFVRLLRNYRKSSRHLVPFASKFVRFTHKYISCSPAAAVAFLQKHLNVLHDLSLDSSDLVMLKSLLAGLSLPSRDGGADRALDEEGEDESSAGSLPLVSVCIFAPLTAAEMAPYMKRLSRGQTVEDLLEVLSDVDEMSRRRPEILGFFSTSLQRLMSSAEESCRSLAFSLALRSIQNNPGIAADFLPTFMYCLGSRDFEVVQTALRNLPEYTLLCQEHAAVLLHRAFLVGMYGQMDTSAQISEALRILHLEAMIATENVQLGLAGLRNFDALRKENVYENNKLAFSVAEEQLGIPALLDAEDMVALKVPDRLSILTYVSQYYNYFQRGASGERCPAQAPRGQTHPALPCPSGPGSACLHPWVSTNRTVQRKDGGTEGPPRKAGQAAGGSLNSSCGVCGQHVHLMQRHLADGRLCKQCSSTLHSGAYRATGEPGVFICSSHHPETTSASPTLPSLASRRHGAMSMDSETPGGLRKTREASGQRDVGPKARLPGWDAVAGSTSARGSASAATDPPAPASSRVPTGSPAVPRLMVGPAGGEARTHVTSSSLTVWPSPAGRPRPTGTPSAPDPCPATPQGWATPRVSAPQTKLSSRPVSPVPASTPAWTPSSSKTQQARERFFQTPGAAPGPGPAAADIPSRDGRKEQALSFLRKTLPELGAPGRAPTTATPAPSSHPRSEGPGASPPARASLPTSPQTLSSPARMGPPATPGVGSTSWASQEAKKGSAASSGAVGAGAGSRLKLEAPLAKGPGASPQGSPEDQPAGWRARLKPVEKSPVDRAPEAKEPQVLREPRTGDAAGKASGSSKAGIHITLTSVRVDRTPGAAGPGASLPAASASASPLRKLAVPASLDVSGDWLQLEPSRKESPARSQKEEEKGPPQGKPGEPPGPAGVAAPPAKSAASPVRLHPDDMPPEIQRQVQDIERQLDALELQGVELEKRLRAAEGDDSEDALMVDWFRLVHEKQLLLRLESELMYNLTFGEWGHHVPEQGGDNRVPLTPAVRAEGLKSPQDRRREQDLLDQYVHTVNSRSDIIDFLDEDRLRSVTLTFEVKASWAPVGRVPGVQQGRARHRPARPRTTGNLFPGVEVWPPAEPQTRTLSTGGPLPDHRSIKAGDILGKYSECCEHHGHDDLAVTTQSHTPSGPAQGTKGLPTICGSMARGSEPILLSPLPTLRPTAGLRYDLEQGPGSPESGDPSDGVTPRAVLRAGGLVRFVGSSGTAARCGGGLSSPPSSGLSWGPGGRWPPTLRREPHVDPERGSRDKEAEGPGQARSQHQELRGFWGHREPSLTGPGHGASSDS